MSRVSASVTASDDGAQLISWLSLSGIPEPEPPAKQTPNSSPRKPRGCPRQPALCCKNLQAASAPGPVPLAPKRGERRTEGRRGGISMYGDTEGAGLHRICWLNPI